MQVNYRRYQGSTIGEKFYLKIFLSVILLKIMIFKNLAKIKKNIPIFWKIQGKNLNLFFSIATISFMNLID